MRCILSATLVIVLWLAAPAAGQIDEPGVKRGNIRMLPEKQPVLEYVLAGCFLLGSMAIGFKASKRGHE